MIAGLDHGEIAWSFALWLHRNTLDLNFLSEANLTDRCPNKQVQLGEV